MGYNIGWGSKYYDIPGYTCGHIDPIIDNVNDANQIAQNLYTWVNRLESLDPEDLEYITGQLDNIIDDVKNLPDQLEILRGMNKELRDAVQQADDDMDEKTQEIRELEKRICDLEYENAQLERDLEYATTKPAEVA